MIFFQIHNSRRLLITHLFNDILIGYLKNGKTGNKNPAICFATWLQNELNSDVASFYHLRKQTLQPYFLQDRVEHGW